MILTNEKMFESVAVLSRAEETGMLGDAIARNRKKLTDEVLDYAKKRDELIAEFGEYIGNGQFRLLPENAARFYEALRPYSELTADVAVMQVAPEVFYSGNLTSAQMFTLSWMVNEEETEEVKK